MQQALWAWAWTCNGFCLFADMLLKMIQWIYFWLPKFFGCHCRSDRSFFIKGRQFPICARCTGELLGIIFSLFLFWFWRPSLLVSVLMLLPLIVDGMIQHFTSYESTNIRRFVTGFVFGTGLMSILVITTLASFYFGFEKGRALR